MKNMCFTPATKLAKQIQNGSLLPSEAVDAYLDRISTRNTETNAFITVAEDHAREAAKKADQLVNQGDTLPPLHGVPIAIKDLFAQREGLRHTYGSPLFSEHISERTVPVVERLEAAGAIVIGKTSTPEFGNRATTENNIIGATASPFAPKRTAGGTSGGSAAAVADGLVALAQGSDAGGSIRIPAACCGVYGLKPSFGRVPNGSRPNAFAEHTPFVQNGPLTRTVADAALMLDVMTGPHPADPFTHPNTRQEGSFVQATERSIEQLSVGYSPDLGLFTVDQTVRSAVKGTVDALADAGAEVERIEVTYDSSRSDIREAWQIFFQILMADIAEQIAAVHDIDLLGTHRDSVDPLFVRIAEAGHDRSLRESKRADRIRTDLYDTIEEIFEQFDLLLTPTLATLPFETGLDGPTKIDGQEVNPYTDWMLTWPFNMTDHPAASIPAGTHDGVPIGAQIVGKRFADHEVLAASSVCEDNDPWSHRYPPTSETG